MTEVEWNSCTDPEKMLEWLRESDRTSPRKLRLFACECCHRIWDMLIDNRSREAVDVSEQYAEGQATAEELAHATAMAIEGRTELLPSKPPKGPAALSLPVPARIYQPAAAAAETTTLPDALEAAQQTDALVERAAIEWAARHRAAQRMAIRVGAKARAAILHDLFGPLPFRAVACAGNWAKPTVLALALAVYDDRTFNRLPALADTLEEAGCNNADILAHLRSPGPHTRGCWPLDLLLNKS